MKKIFAFLLVVFVCVPAFALYTENVPNACTTTDMHAQYQPISYTCDAGYFLPASTDGCRPCPVGYTCPGGTYTADIHYAKGLIFDSNVTYNINNSCGTNIKQMFAVFVPESEDILTINWDDGENTTTTSCAYGESFNLPPAPTRIGYTFTGWKVKTNNNE